MRASGKLMGMNLLESLQWSHHVLTQLKAPHALIGGLALSEYGYSRGTQDVDWLIPEECVSAVRTRFLSEGFQVLHESGDVIQFEGKAGIDFLIARRPISRQMLEDAAYSDHLQMPVVKAEDLIGLKIQAYANNPKRKHKDLADIQELVELAHSKLDWGKIKFYADHFNEWPTLESMKKAAQA